MAMVVVEVIRFHKLSDTGHPEAPRRISSANNKSTTRDTPFSENAYAWQARFLSDGRSGCTTKNTLESEDSHGFSGRFLTDLVF